MRKITLLIVLALCYTTSQAQLGKLLKNKAKAVVEKKINDEVSNATSTSSTSESNTSAAQAEYSDEEFKAALAQKYPNDEAKQELYFQKYKEHQQKQLEEEKALTAKAKGQGTTVTEVPSPVESSEANKFKDAEIYVINRTKYIKRAGYDGGFTDAKGLSGYYHLSNYFFRNPSSHFDNNPGDIFDGFSIEYNPETYELQAYFSPGQKRYGVVPERYRKSADKGNIQFQFGMGSGPDWTNVNALVLEPGVLLIGAEVYHKNENEGHKWMNNAQPKEFIIAAKDPEKIKKYYKNVELTESLTFSKFDELRKDWKGEALSKVVMPAKGSFDNDTAIKNAAVSGLNGYYGKLSMTNLTQYMTSNKWSTVSHKVTGVPLYQWAVGAVVQKNSDGQCMLQQFIIKREYTGGGNYGTPYFNGINRASVSAPYGGYCDCDAKP